MEVVGNFDTMQDMIRILRRELNENLKSHKFTLKVLKKEHDRMTREDIGTEIIARKIRHVEREIEALEYDLNFFSVQYQPIRIFDVVINYKLFKSILQKTKKFNVTIQKGEGNTVEISWDEKGSRGKYTLNDLSGHYENLIYIPELKLEGDIA